MKISRNKKYLQVTKNIVFLNENKKLKKTENHFVSKNHFNLFFFQLHSNFMHLINFINL